MQKAMKKLRGAQFTSGFPPDIVFTSKSYKNDEERDFYFKDLYKWRSKAIYK